MIGLTGSYNPFRRQDRTVYLGRIASSPHQAERAAQARPSRWVERRSAEIPARGNRRNHLPVECQKSASPVSCSNTPSTSRGTWQSTYTLEQIRYDPAAAADLVKPVVLGRLRATSEILEAGATPWSG